MRWCPKIDKYQACLLTPKPPQSNFPFKPLQSGQNDTFLYIKLLKPRHIETLYQKLLHSGRTRSQPTTSTERSMVCLISNSTTSSMLSHRFLFFGVKNISFSVNTNSDANSCSITSHIHLISYNTHSNSKIDIYYATILTRRSHHFLFFLSCKLYSKLT